MIVRLPFPGLRLYRSPSSFQSAERQCYRRQTHQFRGEPLIQLSKFSTSCRRLQDGQNRPNFYETLKVPVTADKAQLKKQFYVLSKETHPDMHPNDPTAAERFAQVSESYAVLSNPEKRKKYDRDVLQLGQNRPQTGSGGGTYAGSRPATGLSKRRGTFRGPPPSFYAHGNPSANTAEQAASSSSDRAHYQAGSFNAGAYAEQEASFNPSITYKTQTHEDMRRHSRRAAQMAAAQVESAEDESNFWVRFIIVSAIVFVGVSVGTLIVSMSNTPRGGLTRGDGSRRTGPKNEWAKG